MNKRPAVAALAAVAVVAVLCCLSVVAVPPLRLLAIEALGGVACTERQCPADAGWVTPVEAGVSSGFRTDARPDHHGVDLAAERGTPVVAASAGLVLTAQCQASLDGEPYGCDRDGSWEVLGCGWYVKILHARHFATLYCHLDQAPEVSAGDTVDTGDLLGYVGSTGNSSEPHLHFEVQDGELFSPPRSSTALDPEVFFADQGTALG